ncbi:MAG TPA: archease [Nitrospira sp.]
MAYSYQFLDDVALADLAFDATGDSLQELFQSATTAVMEALANPATVGTAWERTIDREDRDPSALLFDWLSDLIYWKDAAGVVFRASDLSLNRIDNDMWHLQALIIGEPVTPATQELRADVKGVTKHLYRLTSEGDRWTVRVVLDV